MLETRGRREENRGMLKHAVGVRDAAGVQGDLNDKHAVGVRHAAGVQEDLNKMRCRRS